MSKESYKGLWQGYSNPESAPHPKNQPWFRYQNFKGPVTPIYQEPKSHPQVYNRWTNDAYTKNFLRFCNSWLFSSKKTRAFITILTAFSIEKFWESVLYSIVRYNNLEGTMRHAHFKEEEWKRLQSEEKARRKELGLDDEDEE